MYRSAETDLSPPDQDEEDSTVASPTALERARLVRLCRYLTGNQDVAEDLAQETLLEAWRLRWNFEERGIPDGRERWLAGIARNLCQRWQRKHGRACSHFADVSLSELETLPAEAAEVEFQLERDELGQLLEHALALLPDQTRTALIAHYIHGSPHAKIAAQLGVSPQALAQRLQRGKQAMRQVLSEQLNTEAIAYGLAPSIENERQRATRISCPLCGQGRLIKTDHALSGSTSFACPHCWQIAATPLLERWQGLSSPKAILSQQIAWLGGYYWSLINQQQGFCLNCNGPLRSQIYQKHEFPDRYLLCNNTTSPAGIYIICDACQWEEINALSHLTLDLPAAQDFWRRHPRMRWEPGPEFEAEGQPALLCSFQSLSEQARLDVIMQRQTLQVLGIQTVSK